jgi:hypothetical protein
MHRDDLPSHVKKIAVLKREEEIGRPLGLSHPSATEGLRRV